MDRHQPFRKIYRKPHDCRLKVQINDIDHYQSNPTAFDCKTNNAAYSSRKFHSVPVIRIFGTSEHGQHTLVHIHGVYPYVYIEYRGDLHIAQVETYISQLSNAIDSAMNKAYKRKDSRPNDVFVANIVLCKGVPFYGYHVGWVPYLKIYMVNPSHMFKLVELLRNGDIMGTPIQPYEAHIPYLLQFFADFNLSGCSNINISSALFRGPLRHNNTSPVTGVFDTATVSDSLILPAAYYSKMGFCELELDIDAGSIENRLKIVERNMHHDFNEDDSLGISMEKAFNNDPNNSVYVGKTQNLFRNIKFVNNLKDIWLDEFNRRAHENLSEFKIEQDSSERMYSQNTLEFWKRGQELHDQLETLVANSKLHLNGAEKGFHNFIKERDYMHAYPTALETVGTMFKSWPSVLKELARESMTMVPPSYSQILDVEEEKQESASDDDNNDKEESGTDFDDEELKELDELEFDDLLSYPRSRNGSMIQPGNSNLKQDTPKDSDTFKKATPAKQDRCSTFNGSQDDKSQKRQVSHAVDTSISQDCESPISVIPLKRTLSKDVDSSYYKEKVLKSFKYSPNQSFLSQASNPCMSFLSTSPANSVDKKLLRQVSSRVSRAIGPSCANKSRLMYVLPPTVDSILESFKTFHIPSKVPKDPFFSNPKDIPKGPQIFAGTEFRFSQKDKELGPYFFENSNVNRIGKILNDTPSMMKGTRFKYVPKPPSYDQVSEWCKAQNKPKPSGSGDDVFRSQIGVATQDNRYGFKYSSQKRNKYRKTKEDAYKSLSTMTLETHTKTRAQLFPDPSHDPVQAVFWSFQPEYLSRDPYKGCICVCGDSAEAKRLETTVPKSFILDFEPDELSLINKLCEIVKNYDPDILVGYEVHASSWGYLIERAQVYYEYNLCLGLGRVNEKAYGKTGDRWGYTHTSAIKVTGRHILNVWRTLRNELKLLQYSLENVAFHTLHRRIPAYSHETLTRWYDSTFVSEKQVVIKYHIQRLETTIDIVDTQEIIGKAFEEARIVGTDFNSVFYRGSQFKVESIMVRITKAENFIMVSPSKRQVGAQNAIECLPLILEPETKFYTSPVVVLDFQSLYPSVMIAYNYCYSTCLGRAQAWRGRNKLGFTTMQLPKGLLHVLGKENLTIAPNGLVYVKPRIRKSLLAKMLTEFLETRMLVKDGMKSNKDTAFQNLMNNRQLVLKLIANVIYGYTSATYSGRMPCVEIADSIVQTGRETMERAIEHIKSNFGKWGAEVVYGDTDSLFIHFPGRSKEEAFDLGKEIADSVTNMNPKPMKLKFEKVYYPCILQTKKRYVGYMYEHKDQEVPVFNAKGTETVRRDV